MSATIKVTKYADVNEVFQDDQVAERNVGRLIPLWEGEGPDRVMRGTCLIVGVVVAPDGRSMEIEMEMEIE